MIIQRLGEGDRDRAQALFTLMAGVFETETALLSDPYLDGLLEQDRFWALAAYFENRPVGGLTAHTLPLTRVAEHELFVYDIAVLPAYQRRGVGRRLVEELWVQARTAGIREIFVLADNEDLHALDFYRALGGHATPVTMFGFAPEAF